MFGDWNWDCTSRTLVDSAFGGSPALASFFSAPGSFDDNGNGITRTASQKPTAVDLVQLPAGISLSLLATLFIGAPSGSAGGSSVPPRGLLALRARHPATAPLGQPTGRARPASS